MNDFGFDGPRRPLVWRILLAPFSLVGSFFERFATGDELAGNRGLLGWLYLIFVAPFVWLFANSGRLILGWSSSRQTTAFFLGIPSFLFALIIVSVSAYGTLTPKRLVDAYINRQKIATTTGKFEEAEVYLNKLMRIDQEDLNQRRLEKVELLEKQQKSSEAYRLLLEMTNPDNPESVTNAGAHMKLAQYYMSEEFAKNSGFEKKTPLEKQEFLRARSMQVKHHCEMCLTSGPNKSEEFAAHHWLFLFNSQRNEPKEAEKHLQFIHNLNPLQFALSHYAFYKRLDRSETAEAAADRDAELFLQYLKQNPSNEKVWEALTLFNLARKKFERAMTDLNFAKPLDLQQTSKLRGLRSTILTQASIEQKRKDPLGSRPMRLAQLSEALAYMPTKEAIIELVLLGFPIGEEDDQWLYDAKAKAGPRSSIYYGVNLLLGMKASFAGDEQEAEKYFQIAGDLSPGMPVVLKVLRSMTSEEQQVGDDGKPLNVDELAKQQGAPAVGGIYMILGGHSVANKDFNRGKVFFEKALKLNPSSTAAMNNLAVCIANEEGVTTKQLEEALLIVSDAVNLAPQVPNYYESRGSIFQKLGKYEEAIGDFEKSLAMGFRNQASVWKNLVICCRNAGRIKEAEAYQRSLADLGIPPGDESATKSSATQSPSSTPANVAPENDSEQTPEETKVDDQ